jgi:hypothetical protein
MSEQHSFLISQTGRPLVVVDEASALSRAKGLGHILNFSPSLTMIAMPVSKPPEGIPSFKADYFELLGFR